MRAWWRRVDPLDRIGPVDPLDRIGLVGPVGPLERVGLVALACWLTWVVAATLLAGRPLPLGTPYVVAPLVGVLGVAAGRILAARTRVWPLPEAFFTVAALAAIAGALTPGAAKAPLGYANANAALGVQILALVGLLALARPPGTTNPDLRPDAAASYARSARLATAASGLAAASIVLVNASQAAVALSVPVIAASAWAGAGASGPPRWLTVSGALGALGAAAGGVAWLARHDTWPALALRGLGGTRRQLWHDALALWAEHPLRGGGAGAFRDASPLAADPDTSTVHSSLLQVASELGAVGVVLFAALLAIGLALAVRRDRASGLVAATAWAALGIHSFVDHLYEFAAVTFTATVVLGWASGLRPER